MITTTNNMYTEELNLDLSQIENEDVKKIIEFYGINEKNITSQKELKALGLKENELNTIKREVENAIKKSDFNFDVLKAPDFIQDIINKYGLNNQQLKNIELIEKLDMGKDEKKSLLNYVSEFIKSQNVFNLIK